MKKSKIFIQILILICASFPLLAQEIYKDSGVRIAFFSSAPIEDIEAISREGLSVLNTSTGEISFQVKIRSFEFQKSLMQEHFNENYMESAQHPNATFRGKVPDNIKSSSGGDIPVKLLGILEVHGIKQKREIPAVMSFREGQIELKSEFEVACRDHDIKIPKIMWKKIAEVVLVKVEANYSKLKL